VSDEDPRTRGQHALDALGDAMHEVADTAPETAKAAARDELRAWWPKIVGANAAVTLVIVALIGWLAFQVLGQGAQIDDLQAAAEQAKPQGEAANDELERRGQEPVDIPEPGEGADLDVIVAAATARVLASIPDPSPTAAELGAAIARHMATNPPPGPSTAQLSATLAGYLATNPIPPGPPGADCDPAVRPECRGPQGEQGVQGEPGRDGVDGRTPTEADIQMAFVAFVEANPDFLPAALCQGRGSFGEAEVRAADGGTVTGYLCITSSTPPDDGPDLPILGG
jgi:hypothetical protein